MQLIAKLYKITAMCLGRAPLIRPYFLHSACIYSTCLILFSSNNRAGYNGASFCLIIIMHYPRDFHSLDTHHWGGRLARLFIVLCACCEQSRFESIMELLFLLQSEVQDRYKT